MGEKRFKTEINDFIQILSYIYTEKGIVIKFVVKLTVLIGNKWEEVCRYDCHHGKPHKDILKPDGMKYKVIEYNLNNKQILDLAYKDFKENYDLYIERYMRWKMRKE